MKKFVTLLFLLILTHTASPLRADWPCRPDTALPVSVAPGNQWNVQLASDGKSGAYFVWQDRRNGSEDKLYCQHVSATGSAVWTDGGIPLALTGGYQYYPQIIGDGAGGAFIAWQDNRTTVDYDIYLQRISPLGNPLWPAAGVPVCTAPGHQYNPQIVADGLGGVYVTWQDKRNGQFDIYAQHLDSAGTTLWRDNGVPICSKEGDQIQPVISNDGLNSAIIAWTDFRSGSGFSDIYAQRILPNGQLSWQPGGMVVCQATNTQWNIRIAPDGAGSAYFVWQDRRSGTYDNIYAQFIDITGTTKFAADGIPLAPYVSIQYYPQVVADGAGGIVATWQENRTGSNYDIYAQRVNKSGQLLWNGTGQPVCLAPANQYNPQIVAQNGSVIIAWQDRRNGTDYNIYAQRLNPNGQSLWATDGNPVSSSALDQFAPQIVSDNVNGIIAGWADYRGGFGTTDIFGQRIGANGLPAGGCYRTITQTGYSLKGIRTYFHPTKSVVMPNEGNVRDTVFRHGAFAAGLFLGYPRIDAPRVYAWELFTSSQYVRRALSQYGPARPLDKLFDRSLVNVLRNPSVTRYDNRLSGELLTLKINIAMSDEGLTQPNLGEIVFHDTAQTPNVLNNKTLRQVASYVDSTLTYWRNFRTLDYGKLGSWLGRINLAFSGPMDTVSLSPLRLTNTVPLYSLPFFQTSPNPPPPIPQYQPLTGSDDNFAANFTLFQNYPNPFNPMTTIEFSLPVPSIVTMRVYNVLGQEVATLLNRQQMDPGMQMVDFNAAALTSGVYFYQLAMQDLTTGLTAKQMKKMLLVK